MRRPLLLGGLLGPVAILALVAAVLAPHRAAPVLAAPTASASPAAPTVARRLVVPGLVHDEPRAVTIAAVGDLMLARTVGERIQSDPSLPLGAVAPVLKGADIAVGNLECAVATGGVPAAKGFTFRAPPAAAAALVSAGIDVVSLANNHSLDYGVGALGETVANLDANSILHAGAGADDAAAHAPAVIERNGLRIAFLAYADVPVEWRGFDTRSWIAGPDSPGLAWLDIPRMRAEIASAKRSADVVVVLLHFGIEDQRMPSPLQVEEARAAVDAGASLVIGSHPHVLQPVERYGDGLIAYSMGNFVFDGDDNPTNESAILLVTLTGKSVTDYRLAPVVIDAAGFPHLAE